MKENNENRIPIELIAAMLSGEASEQELRDLDKWIAQSEENQKIISEYKKLWQKSAEINPSDPIDSNEEWDRFSAANSVNGESGRKIRTLHLLRRIAVAASVIIILGIGSILTYNSVKYEKVLAANEREAIKLPDGSMATLYPGSSIKYPKKFNNDSRPVKLDGEAFFEVIKDSLRTFSVSSSDMIVRVLGTSFNVEAFLDREIFNVVVKEGKVAVSKSSGQEKTKYLLPGQKASFNRTDKIINKQENNDINYDAWHTGKIVFENTGLKELAATLSKVYMADIQVISRAVDQNISVSFDNRPLEYILSTIEATLDVEIVKENAAIIIK